MERPKERIKRRRKACFRRNAGLEAFRGYL